MKLVPLQKKKKRVNLPENDTTTKITPKHNDRCLKQFVTA
jgi:hypothetical protein